MFSSSSWHRHSCLCTGCPTLGLCEGGSGFEVRWMLGLGAAPEDSFAWVQARRHRALAFSCGLSGQQSLPASKETSSVVLEAKPVKTVYAREEAVEFDFVLRNDGTDPVIVPRALRLSLSVELEISNPVGQQPRWRGRIADEVIPSKNRYRSLAPGESLHARLTVSCVDRDQPNRAWGYLLDMPGSTLSRPDIGFHSPKNSSSLYLQSRM